MQTKPRSETAANWVSLCHLARTPCSVHFEAEAAQFQDAAKSQGQQTLTPDCAIVATTYVTDHQEDISCCIISIRSRMSAIDSKGLT
jgi:hypothetical protein